MSEQTSESEQPAEKESYISIDDFAKVELRTAEVLAVEDHPNADKLLKLSIKLGDEERTLCAGIKEWYSPEDLVGKTIVVVANLKPRKLRGVESQGMLLAVGDEENNKVVPLTVMDPIRSGLRVS